MPVTLSQVALKSGVSVAAASRVLNHGGGNTRVSQDTRLRVREMAGQLGYRAIRAKRIARRGRCDTFAIVQGIHAERSELPLDLLRGLQQACRQIHTHLLVERLGDDDLLDGEVPQWIGQLVCDGVLFDYTHGLPEGLADLLDRYHVPVVWLNRKCPHHGIYPDDFAGAYKATRQLISRGHQRIQMIAVGQSSEANPADSHYSEVDRHAGYVQAMREAGLNPIRHLRPADVPETESSGLIRSLLASADRPTAVLTYDDRYAMTTAHQAARMGLDVPRDLSIVGFGHSTYPQMGIDFTMIHLPWRQIGHTAIQMLEQRISNPDQSLPSRAIRPDWHEGQTIAPPASN